MLDAFIGRDGEYYILEFCDGFWDVWMAKELKHISRTYNP